MEGFPPDARERRGTERIGMDGGWRIGNEGLGLIGWSVSLITAPDNR